MIGISSAMEDQSHHCVNTQVPYNPLYEFNIIKCHDTVNVFKHWLEYMPITKSLKEYRLNLVDPEVYCLFYYHGNKINLYLCRLLATNVQPQGKHIDTEP